MSRAAHGTGICEFLNRMENSPFSSTGRRKSSSLSEGGNTRASMAGKVNGRWVGVEEEEKRGGR
jgi:hypothetical protein